ncbi:hypothetical protein, partial [Clostridium perfringens]|uniref:hypothetical protein n=1 Tax=Clostridium perfringens TaxID=1502 RepID=UPI0032DB8FE4
LNFYKSLWVKRSEGKALLNAEHLPSENTNSFSKSIMSTLFKSVFEKIRICHEFSMIKALPN